jgi:hypothetical protein
MQISGSGAGQKAGREAEGNADGGAAEMRMARAWTRRILLAAFVALSGIFSGCGSVGSSGSGPPPNVTVSVAPDRKSVV